MASIQRSFHIGYNKIATICDTFGLNYGRNGDGWGILPTIQNSPIFNCDCGLKYIKTRGSKQPKCLFCLGFADRRNIKNWT